tara:strand:+ start:187 stop:429 length:243 start_codon:yes stop_codon:yes gene_type:complete
LLKDLLSINKNIPATSKIEKSNVSNKFFSIDIDAPKKAKGIDPIKYGKSNLMFIFLVLTKFIEFPDTTMMLQNNAKIGKI